MHRQRISVLESHLYDRITGVFPCCARRRGRNRLCHFSENKWKNQIWFFWLDSIYCHMVLFCNLVSRSRKVQSCPLANFGDFFLQHREATQQQQHLKHSHKVWSILQYFEFLWRILASTASEVFSCSLKYSHVVFCGILRCSVVFYAILGSHSIYFLDIMKCSKVYLDILRYFVVWSEVMFSEVSLEVF